MFRLFYDITRTTSNPNSVCMNEMMKWSQVLSRLVFGWCGLMSEIGFVPLLHLPIMIVCLPFCGFWLTLIGNETKLGVM